MRVAFREATQFARVRDHYFLDDDNFRAMQNALIEDPLRGPVIPGCGGLRKVRWPDTRRGKGKRGGLRVIYLYIPEAEMILLLQVYDKDEADDLSPEDRRYYAAAAAEIKENLRKEFERR